MPKKIGFALLSFAHSHGYAWANAIKKSNDADLIGIWDDNYRRGEEAAEKFDTKFYQNLDLLLAEPAVDAVGICSETNRHAELTIRAAKAKKDILCEKPMATTLEDCERMIEACKREDVIYMQGFPKRFDPVYLKIKELIDSGTIGKIGTVRMRHGHYFALNDKWMTNKDADWIRDPNTGGGGAFFDEGMHAVDILHLLFGEPISVMAAIDNILVPMEVDDNGAAIWRFKNKIIAIQQSNWTDLAATNTLEIYGDKGVIIQKYSDCSSTRFISELSKPLMVYRANGKMQGWEIFDLPVHFPTYQETVPLKFIECLRDGKEPYVTAEDGRNALEMVLGAYQAAKDERTVYFPLNI